MWHRALFLLAAAAAAGATPSPSFASGISHSASPAIGLTPGDFVDDHGARVIVPSAGNGTEAFVDFPNGSTETVSVFTSESGVVSVEDWGDEATNGPSTTVGATPTDPQGCDDGAYGTSGYHWFKPGGGIQTMNWYFNSSSKPENVSVDNAESALQAGATNITSSSNACGYSDQISATHAYQGRNSRGVNIGLDTTCAPSGNGYDGVNEVGFGDLNDSGPDPVAVTCNHNITDNYGDKITIESDIRFNKTDYLPMGRQPRARLRGLLSH